MNNEPTRVCASCAGTPKDNGIAYRNEHVAECMFCEALREELIGLATRQFEQRLAASIGPLVRKFARAAQVSAPKHKRLDFEHRLAPAQVARACNAAYFASAAAFEVEQDELVKSRCATPALARQIAWAACADLGAPLAGVGRHVKAHHTTVLHGVRVARRAIIGQPRIAQAYDAVIAAARRTLEGGSHAA